MLLNEGDGGGDEASGSSASHMYSRVGLDDSDGYYLSLSVWYVCAVHVSLG
jgi:hypothetical protein